MPITTSITTKHVCISDLLITGQVKVKVKPNEIKRCVIIMVGEQNQTVWERPLRAGQRNSTLNPHTVYSVKLGLEPRQHGWTFTALIMTPTLLKQVYPLFQPNQKCHRHATLDFLAKNLLSCEQRHPIDTKQFYPVKLL